MTTITVEDLIESDIRPADSVRIVFVCYNCKGYGCEYILQNSDKKGEMVES